jgi:S-DNA-T family DNA segregation ATPase FtsK/SpoIIIE
MLYMAADAAKLVRIQGTYVSDREVEKIVDFWRKAVPPEGQEAGGRRQEAGAGGAQRVAPAGDPSAGAVGAQRAAPAGDPSVGAQRAAPEGTTPADEQFRPPAEFLSADEQDDLLPQARALVQQHQRASASLLQRRLRIGYSKAAQLIDLLEQQGVVGPPEGGRSREVLRSDER